MGKEIVMSVENILDTITIEDKHTFSTYTSIGLCSSGDFYIRLKFNDVTLDLIKKLQDLYNLSKALKFNSAIVAKENYNITHIVVTNMKSDSTPSYQWECLSDDPTLSLIIE